MRWFVVFLVFVYLIATVWLMFLDYKNNSRWRVLSDKIDYLCVGLSKDGRLITIKGE